jgi:hypothetical protein
MDTARITDPITDHLPAAGATIISTVADVTAGLADHITDQVGQVDLADAARRTRYTVARFVPWMSVSRSSRFRGSTRRWLVLGAATAAVIAIVVVSRRRSSGSNEPPRRDDWSTGSPNGSSPRAESSTSDREAATTRA